MVEYADRPADRPPGIPGNARFAGAGIAFGIIFIVVDGIAVASGSDMTIYLNLGTYAFLPLIIVAVATIALLNLGKLWLIRMFRGLAGAVTVVYVAAIVLDGVRLALYPVNDVLLSGVAGVAMLLFSPLLVLMWRDFRRSRWLDPGALPHEWELAAIRDPNSFNYRRPKPPKRGGDI